KKFGESEFTSAKSGELTKGVFADGGAAAAETSALSGWHNVFVPYCTGDVHSGNATDVEIKGASGKQQFVGLINIRNIADLLGEYFDGVQTVFLIGQSAGGFGTNLGFLEFAQAFPGNDVNVFNDSAPLPADNDVLSPVLQFGLRSLWNVVPPPGCDDCGTKFDGLENIQKYNATEYPNSTFGLYSYLEDETIRDFFQVGDPITGEAYAAGLEDLRDNLLEPTGRWSTFFIEGTGHAPSTSDTYFEIEEGGTSLQEWVEELATASDPPASVAP
ncbi:hypothetical protein KDL45_17305, partial [bacterium]|nr:hypothetical protein [bacterium]